MELIHSRESEDIMVILIDDDDIKAEALLSPVADNLCQIVSSASDTAPVGSRELVTAFALASYKDPASQIALSDAADGLWLNNHNIRFGARNGQDLLNELTPAFKPLLEVITTNNPDALKLIAPKDSVDVKPPKIEEPEEIEVIVPDSLKSLEQTQEKIEKPKEERKIEQEQKPVIDDSIPVFDL